MELPDHGVTNGEWDLRRGVDEYLGNVSFAGQRVLEIGPASGFLTFEMEKRGAEVISVEVTARHGWDFVPYPASKLQEVFGPRQIVMQRLRIRIGSAMLRTTLGPKCITATFTTCLPPSGNSTSQ
jgi:hypothetical protein